MATFGAGGSQETNDAEYITDDSDFYGDEQLRTYMEGLVQAFDPAAYHSVSRVNLLGNALTNLAAEDISTAKAQSKLYNPYEGMPSARQLSEPVSAFLERLPPSTSKEATAGPWIWIFNPHSKKRETDGNLAALKAGGDEVLDTFSNQVASITNSMLGKTKTAISRAISPLRHAAVAEVLDIAQRCHVTTGKWMLFLKVEDVDRIWKTVAEGILAGELGCGAKVSTGNDRPSRTGRLICVYTENFADKDDVTKILVALVEKGLAKVSGLTGEPQGIYYKCDAFTHLGIDSENEWGIKASMYSSRELLKAISKAA